MVKKLSEQKNNEVGAPLQLQQLKGGKALTVTVCQKRKCKEIQVKSQTVAKIKKKLRLSDRATETVCRLLREDKVSVEQGTRKFLSEVDKLLVPYYENVKMIMEVRVPKTVVKMVRGRGGKIKKKLVVVKKIVKKEKNVTIVKNAASFCQKIAEMRNIAPDDAMFRVCQDGGGRSFKSVVSVMDRKMNPEAETKGEMLSGVNRLLPLALCPGIPERHFNLRKIMEHLRLHEVPNLKVVMDLCLLNAHTGVSSHGGKYSCAFCDGPSSLQSGTLRTFGHLAKKYSESLAGANPARMKDFCNVIQPCLTVASPEVKVIDVHPLPELHLHIGVVNHLAKLCINVDEKFLDLLKKHNIFRHGYQGGGLDGNNSYK